MADYYKHLYNYAEIIHRSPNRKLLLNWIHYIEEHEIPDGECYNESLDFMMNDPNITSKSKSTRRNYNSEINKFNEYIYEQEGWTLPWNKTQPEQKTETQIQKPQTPPTHLDNTYNKLRKQEHETRKEKTNPEYEAFLKRYEALK